MCLYGGAGVRFERERDWNRTGEVQAQLTVDQTVSTVPARVTGNVQVTSLKVGICKSDYLWYGRTKCAKLESASWTLRWYVVTFDGWFHVLHEWFHVLLFYTNACCGYTYG